MLVSLIITGGYIQHQDIKKSSIEFERLIALTTCLLNAGTLDTSKGDEIIFAEYGERSKLKNICDMYLKNVNYKYVFVEGKGFNQSLIKNAGAQVASNEIICWINSDVIIQHNIFDILRSRFEKNSRIFATGARHDLFCIKNKLKLIHDINSDAYILRQIQIDDAGWHHALKQPKTPILTKIKFFTHFSYPTHFLEESNGYIVYDFLQGYINYGELIAITKEVWKRYPFDEEITAIVDSYIRDIIFGNEDDFKLELIHDQTSIFHLSGSDYMMQEVAESDKYKRLIEDMIKAAKKYPCMQHWLVFSYFPQFDDTIRELNIPFKEILEKWRTPLMWKYYRSKERVKELYGVLDE